MFTKVGKAAAAAFLMAALLVCACSPEPEGYATARKPTGVREPLRQGHWRGPIGQTEVDFTINQVLEKTVSVRVSGTVLRQANRSMQSSDAAQNYFYDRPRACKRTADGKTFDCTRYTDMHIDNGLLCGVYDAPEALYRPCLQPAR